MGSEFHEKHMKIAVCESPFERPRRSLISALETRSDIGRECRDALLSLAKTCDKLGIAIWDYLGSRLKVAGHAIIAPLGHYVRSRLRPA